MIIIDVLSNHKWFSQKYIKTIHLPINKTESPWTFLVKDLYFLVSFYKTEIKSIKYKNLNKY